MALRRKVMVWVYRTEPAFQVLLLKRVKNDKGDWHPVTGNVEAHEAVAAAAFREVQEETGLDVAIAPLGITSTFEIKDGRKPGRYHETAYAARLNGSDKVTLSDEHTAHEWVSVATAMDRVAWPDQKRALEALAKKQ